MRGITEERLKSIMNDSRCEIHPEVRLVIASLLEAECTELNPWQPIESAPLNKKIRLFWVSSNKQVECTLYSEEDRKYFSHWQELPISPKTDKT